MTMTRDVNFAIAGCGNIAGRHAEQVKMHGGLLAVCDIVEERAAAFAKIYGCRFYASLEKMLQCEPELDAVSICTPNGLHASQSIICLQAGKHVLCEKPMAISSTDCKKMINAAETSGKKLFIVKQNRYNPPVMAVKRALNEGRLGKILSLQLNCFWNRDESYYRNNWKGTLLMDGGILYTQFSHFIDLLYWFAGDVISLQGIQSNRAHTGMIEFADTVVVAAKHTNGALATMHFNVNSYKKNMEGSITLFCEKGTVKIGGQYLNELSYQLAENYTIECNDPGMAANNYGNYEGSMSNHHKVYEHVIEHIRTNKTGTNATESMKTVEIIERIYKSVITAI